MGTKNQDIIVTKINFWIIPTSVTDRWKSVIQGCIQSYKDKALFAYQIQEPKQPSE